MQTFPLSLIFLVSMSSAIVEGVCAWMDDPQNSKDHFASTRFNWLSMENLNWNTPSPTSTIRTLEPIFHTNCSEVLATRWLKGLLVRNLPNRLREHSSNILSLCTVPTLITTPSSSVNLMFCSFWTKFESIIEAHKTERSLIKLNCQRKTNHTTRLTNNVRRILSLPIWKTNNFSKSLITQITHLGYKFPQLQL